MPNQPHSPSAEPTARRSHILTALLTHHRSALQRQAAKHSQRPADAEDALQDACVQFLGHYQGPPGTQALRWMMLVTKRCAWAIAAPHRDREVLCELSVTDAPRQPNHPVIVAEADPDLDPARLTERADQQAERLAALGRLKPDERSALLLLGLGLSYREIAERRAWTYTKVNRCLAEGRAALRQATQIPTAPSSAKAPRRASRIAPAADPPRS
jgi:RNA polymerase sigma factor (sigma-70 family)